MRSGGGATQDFGRKARTRLVEIGTVLFTAALAFAVPIAFARWLEPQHPRYAEAIYFGTGLAVLWYTLETRGMRQEMVRTRLRLETPEVLIRLDRTLDPSIYSGFFDLIVENPSQAPALEIIFMRVPDFPVGGGRRTVDIGFLRNGIRYLAPGDKQRAFFLNYPALGSEQQQGDVQFQYSFKDSAGQPYSRTVTMNLSAYFDAMTLGRPFEAALLEELRLIRDTLNERL